MDKVLSKHSKGKYQRVALNGQIEQSLIETLQKTQAHILGTFSNPSCVSN